MNNILEILQSLDLYVLLFINQNLSNQFFDFIMPLFDNVKNWIPFILIIWLFMVYKDKKNRIYLLILIPLVIMAGDSIGYYIKHLILRERPWFEYPDLVRNLGGGGGQYLSFPSNHSLNIVSISTVFSYLYSSYSTYFWMYACIIIFSRMYIGVHYPLDVGVGALLGFAVGTACIKLVNYIRTLLWNN